MFTWSFGCTGSREPTCPPTNWIARLALRDGELDSLLASAIDVPRSLADTTAELLKADVGAVIDATLSSDPLMRRQGLLEVLKRMAARDGELLTLGIRVLAAQTRDVLAQLLHDLLVVSFDLVRSASQTHSLSDPLAEQVRASLGIRHLHEFCFALDEAHRSLAVYGPVEGILLSLFLTSEGETHGS